MSMGVDGLTWEGDYELTLSSNMYGDGIFGDQERLIASTGDPWQYSVHVCMVCWNWQVDWPHGCGGEVDQVMRQMLNVHLGDGSCLTTEWTRTFNRVRGNRPLAGAR